MDRELVKYIRFIFDIYVIFFYHETYAVAVVNIQ